MLGDEIDIAEGIYQFITDLFVQWNIRIEERSFKIIKTDKGFYDNEPIPLMRGFDKT